MPYAFLVFSPFLFLFQIHDFAGGFRKEIIFLALLTFTVWQAKTVERSRFKRRFFAILWLYPALVLSHEASIIWLPLLLVVYVHIFQASQPRWRMLMLAIVPSVLAFGLALWFRGDNQTVADILFSLREAGFLNFSAAIAALNDTPAQAMGFTASFMQSGAYLYYYPQAVLLALLAFIPLRVRLSALVSPLTLALFLLALLGSAVLIIAAADWGRFIYAILASLFLLSLLPKGEGAVMPIAPMRLALPGLFVVAYASLWYLPHSENANPYIWKGFVP
ncbi:MAG TPA: hypothetical protein EYG79_14665 [Rhodobacteraceae bacterium]|nr:hypothetical protein [Paracoccaceae bacterium]